MASRLLSPGESQAITFETPKEPGIYPYVCTYPGHWRRMFGALYVVANLEEYQRSPEAYIAANPMTLKDELLKSIGRNTEWKYDNLVASVKMLPNGRSFEVGKKLFSDSNCVACHKMNNDGRELGPDLTKTEPAKHTTEALLRSILEPSKDIAEKYQSYSFLMSSGSTVTGMIVSETPTQVKVLVDPLAKGEPAVLDVSDIEERKKSTMSIMPQGLLNKLTQEEIFDLMAYVYSKGDKKNELYQTHAH
jgi:putative heme-binding domain-containing protein